MSENKAQGFLEHIIAHPDDDTPRLIFADWLEEQGDAARAEFIRVQVERAQLPHWDARQVRLRLREQQLIEQHGRTWNRGLPSIKGAGWGSGWGEFRRGFVATATFSGFAVFRATASACWAATPIEAVSIRWPRKRESIESIPPIPGLRELSITGRLIDPGEVGRLADAPLLSTLRALNLRNCSLGVEGFRRLLTSPHLGNLTALRVPFNSIGNGGISALFDAVSLNSLTELDLSESGNYGSYGDDPIVDAAGLESLAAWPGMDRVRSLTLSGNHVEQAGLRALLCSPRATHLKELVLRANYLGGQAMQEFIAAQPKLQLDVLDLGENLLGDQGAACLAVAPCLRELKALALDRCELPLSAARRLAKALFIGSLRRLNVNHNSFGPEGLRALLDTKPQSLHTLQMAYNDLGNEGVSYLADCPASDSLQEVDLSTNRFGNDGAVALSMAKHLRSLLILRLYSNEISEWAADALVQSPLGKRLAVLDVPPNPDEIPF
ncbi:MAG TPA: TIGR02996 domain-containing protein [Gemmataceae bacterium]|nr:TIGR02996 domain-containing protein [Gemmataceae bacterium]